MRQSIRKSCFTALIAAAILFLTFSALPSAQAAPAGQLKAAFVRGGNLWVKQADGVEKQLTRDGGVSYPAWSYDGSWLAYYKSKEGESREIWLYEISTGRHEIIFQGAGSNVQWSPTRNIVAFADGGVLNTSDTERLTESRFSNVALGVNNYAWLPDGTGFLASSSADRLPDGWTNPLLFQIPLNANLDESKIRRFFTIPSELKHGNVTILSIGTTTFKWSADGKWIAFVVHPTASWSADSDMLCLLSSDGKTFTTVDEMLANASWFQWAPRTSQLAYIQGGGRMALENKHLKVKKAIATPRQPLTPPGYVDGGFTWLNDDAIVVARAKESAWQQQPTLRPLPSLVQVRLRNAAQRPLPAPPAGFGDFAPFYSRAADKLGWVRSDRTKANVMLGSPDGADARVWIESIDLGGSYYEQWDWRSVLSWFDEA